MGSNQYGKTRKSEAPVDGLMLNVRDLVVDDDRTLSDDPQVMHVRNSADAIAALGQLDHLEELWLDHDLGGDDTTRPVALWLAERAFNGDPFDVGCVYVHSGNPVGAQWLMSVLDRYYEVRRAPVPRSL